ncbi:ATP-binding protein [Rhodococcus sp. SBT000017]|uniref:ATP-binding protein n=1 Tax=Rhodococcus sp. SBT000017 TaxID=1803385 RepID=UPI000EF8D9E5|nr:ATP-binding protein [Rhodococcus sp. SBT000017]RMB71926.1 ATP-binding protein [Rhodococcus sp. SBT000017]
MSEISTSATTNTAQDQFLSRSIGLHHTLASALADLIDNSIDARAHNVLVRFIQDGAAIVGLMVIDNGRGMDHATIDAAMSYGTRRNYSTSDLGHFGVGLKAASMSQAESLFVWSKADGHDAQARSIHGANTQQVHSIDPTLAGSTVTSIKPRFPFVTGTVVEWRGIRSFLMSADADEQVSWLEATIGDIRSHLGIVFHRLLGKDLTIGLDVFDIGYKRAGALNNVKPIDPFGYLGTGGARYPMPLDTGTGSTVLAHIWPARSQSTEFKLFGAPGRDWQGLYFYRNDRLLQIGGWNGLWHGRPDFGLARIAIDLDDDLRSHVTINPEKSGVVLDATAVAVLQQAILREYDGRNLLSDATSVLHAARSHTPRPISVVEPFEGFPQELSDAFSDAFTFVDGVDPVSVGWRVLARDAFFEVDLKTRTLWINARFRREILGRKGTDNTDVPILRTLLYLLVHSMFDVHRHSSRQQEQMQAWQDVLVAAMSAHREQMGALR